MATLPRNFAACLCWLVLAALAGCNDPPAPLPPLAAGPPAAPPVVSPLRPDEAAGVSGRDYVLVVHLQLITHELPLGAGGDERIWQHVDTEALGLAAAMRLARNGVMAGVGRGEDIDGLTDVLREMHGQSNRHSTLTVLPGTRATMELRTSLGEQTIFVYRDDHTIAGRDYPPGDNMLALLCMLNSDMPTAARVAVAPHVRSARRRPRISPGGEGGIAHRHTEHALEELAFDVDVPAGGFVLLGPRRQAPANSAGQALFRTGPQPPHRDTVHILIVDIFATPLHSVYGGAVQPAPIDEE